MRNQAIFFLLVFYHGLPLTMEFGMFATEDLYKNGVDIGITSFERSQVNETLQKTTKPWLIQFYSSWCGHCQHFAPTFKEFGIRAQGFTDVMGFGVINCAQEYNTQACRDYDINGYPSLKLFSPKQAVSNVGELIRAHDVQSLITEVTNFVETLERNDTTQLLTFAPDLTYLKTADPNDIFKSRNKRYEHSKTAILIFCDEKSNTFANGLILDFYHLTKSSVNQVIIRKVSKSVKSYSSKQDEIQSNKIARKLIENIHLKEDEPFPFAVAIHQSGQGSDLQGLANPFESQVLITAGDTPPDPTMVLNTLVKYSKTSVTAIKGGGGQAKQQNSGSLSSKERGVLMAPEVKQVEDAALTKKRRYTVYITDLENALLYSLSHEVAQKKSIIGKAFDAYKHYLEVLIKLFPTKGREKTLQFLQELYKWTNTHEDGILGEDLSVKIVELKIKFSAFNDVSEYIGCKGSSPKYGNYPCALWSLWHVLTVRQSQQVISEPSFVLSTMVEYIEQFFGCRDCAENFLKEAEHGAAIHREIKSTQDSILWLWKAHNKVNLRLRHDTQTDDPAYPKFIFPDEKVCSECHLQGKEALMKTEIWSLDGKEYNVAKTLDFIKDMYLNIDMSNLKISSEKKDERKINPKFSQIKNQVAVIYNDNILGKNKHKDDPSNNMLNSNSDVSLMFLVYGVSIALLFVVLVKVIYRRNGRCLLTILYPCQKYFHTYSSPTKTKDKFMV